MDIAKMPIDKIKEYREVEKPERSPKARQIWVEERISDLVLAINEQIKVKGCDVHVKEWIEELNEVKNML